MSRQDNLHFALRRTLEKDAWQYRNPVNWLMSIFQNEGESNHDTP
jgi:hypothetical protein